jgi:hypothetical protein
MSAPRSSFANALMLAALTVTGVVLWMLHARAWELGGRSPVLASEGAEVAVAARELAHHGRWASLFALPLELVFHAAPPWPVANVPPGLVVIEAAVLRVLPDRRDPKGFHIGSWARPDQQELPLVIVPVVAYLMIALSLGLATRHLMMPRTASGAADHEPAAIPGALRWRAAAAGLVLGATFLLDPEAQRFAVGVWPQLPVTFGLIGAIAALALDHAGRRPFLFGLLLGLLGTLGGSLLAFAPVLALAAGWTAPRRRVRATMVALLGFALPLLPWWLYQWRTFGTPGWDLGRYVLWDGVQGRSWFALSHLPALPDLPQGTAALGLLAAKILRNLPGLMLATMTGPRALWVAALIAWMAVARPPRSQRIAGLAVLAIGGVSLGVAAASIPWLRTVFPARVLTECAGILACWGLLGRAAEMGVSRAMRGVAAVFVAVLALGWGAAQTLQGLGEARVLARERPTPGALTLLQISVLMNREIPAGEPVMSNLGPELAWHARRPVIHLALRPEDVPACRRLTEFRNVILFFRDSSRVWPGWQDLVAHPVETTRDPDSGVRRVRQFRSSDGFTVTWLELALPEPKLAVSAPGGAGTDGGEMRSEHPPAPRTSSLRHRRIASLLSSSVPSTFTRAR